MNKFQMLKLFKYVFIVLFLLLEGCSDKPLNSPYSSLKNKNVFYSSFQERPKHLDPARSYSSNEYAFDSKMLDIVNEIYADDFKLGNYKTLH